MSDSLDAILAGNAGRSQPAAEQPVADAPPEPTGETPELNEAEAETEGEQPGATEQPEQEPEQGAPPAPKKHFKEARQALEQTRNERNDFKARAIQAETRLEELQRQLEEAKKAPPPAPPPQQAPHAAVPHPNLPNPVEDPEGYARAIRQNIEQDQFNQRLNISEQTLRARHQDVDEKIGWFKEAQQQNPALAVELRRQPDPYAWAYQQGQKFHEVREISSDPAAYRARIEAEIRAQMEQAAAAPAQATKPVPNLPSSLATARSAGTRGVPAWTGPESLDAILKG